MTRRVREFKMTGRRRMKGGARKVTGGGYRSRNPTPVTIHVKGEEGIGGMGGGPKGLGGQPDRIQKRSKKEHSVSRGRGSMQWPGGGGERGRLYLPAKGKAAER